MADGGLGPGAYLAGSASVAAVLGALTWGAWRLRRALLPAWTGSRARLAEVVIALAALVGVAQVGGALGAFTAGWMLVGYVVVGTAMALVGSRLQSAHPVARAQRGGSAGVRAEPAVGSRRQEIVVATLAVAVVAAQWTTHVAHALGRGMTHPDTLWYHAPYAARFVQDGRVTGLVDHPDVIQAYFPLNAQLVHGLAILPFGRDLLSPVVNLGWAALALLAAWCIGRRRGMGALCVLGAVVVLGLPTLAGTQPGQASNDVVTAALFLAAVALLFESELDAVPTGLAAVAAGLALGTKLSVALPVAVVTVGVVFLALRARRATSALAWCAALALSGGYWFVRNWTLADNPLPWFELEAGPLSLPARAREKGATIAENLTDGSVWRELYLPGLSQGFGRVWPLVLALGLGAGVATLTRDRRPLERLAGLALLGGLLGYLFIPSGGGLNFAYNVRYLTPVLLVGFALLPLALDGLADNWRVAAVIVLAGLVVLDVTARHRERIPAWPTGGLVPGVVVGLGVLAGVLLFARSRAGPIPLARAGLATALGVAVAVGGGWWLQRHYLEHRYVDAGLHIDRIYERFRDVQDARVAVIGTVEVLPMFGLDLSNRVTQLEGRGGRDTPVCTRWRALLDGRDRYVVLDRFGVVFAELPPAEWFEEDPAATEVIREGDSVVYRVEGKLRPPECER